MRSEALRQVSSCRDPGVDDVVVNSALDYPEGAPELQRRGRVVGGQQGAEQPVVELGVEERHSDAVRGQDVAVLPLQALDHALEAETAEVVGHLRRGVGVAEQAGYEGTEAPVGEAVDGVEADAEGADQSHGAFVPEAQSSGSLALMDGGQLDPLQKRGRYGTALAGTLDCKQAGVGGPGLGLEFGQVGEAAVAAEVVRAVADELDTEGATLLQVLLDPGVAVEDVEGHLLGAPVDHLGGEGAGGVATDLAGEDELDFVGAAQGEVVGDEGVDEGTQAAGSVEDQRAGGLDLAHGELPPVAALALSVPERGGDDGHPAVEEGLDLVV